MSVKIIKNVVKSIKIIENIVRRIKIVDKVVESIKLFSTGLHRSTMQHSRATSLADDRKELENGC